MAVSAYCHGCVSLGEQERQHPPLTEAAGAGHDGQWGQGVRRDQLVESVRALVQPLVAHCVEEFAKRAGKVWSGRPASQAGCLPTQAGQACLATQADRVEGGPVG